MPTSTGLSGKLWRAFVWQAVLISVAVILSVYAARFILSDILIKQALEQEAEHYWQQYEQQAQFPRPNTHNLRGYLSSSDVIPNSWLALTPGFHKLNLADTDISIVHVSEHGEQQLFLQFDGTNVGELAFWFGFAPLIVVLIIIYLSSWLAYRFSKQAVSPVMRLAAVVQQLDPTDNQSFAQIEQQFSDGLDQEVATLSQALSALAHRVEDFVARERAFTRDASHELRSPITVIKLTSDVLLNTTELDDKTRHSVERIKRNADDMEELIEALLLLAREADNELVVDTICINNIVAEELERTKLLHDNKSIQLEKTEQVRLYVKGNAKVLSVLIGNIIRNAYSYTDEGRVHITIQPHYLFIEDSGTGISAAEVSKIFRPFYRAQTRRRGGHGVGLTIVKMLSDRFNWPVSIVSEPNVGTQVTVHFPEAEKAEVSPSHNLHAT